MSLKVTIETEYKNALKSKDKIKISTYRLILSGIKDLEISNRSVPDKKETKDEDIKKLLKKMIKQRYFGQKWVFSTKPKIKTVLNTLAVILKAI